MNLTLENEIGKNNTKNNEVENFIQELQNTLEKDNANVYNFYNEIYQELPLASKFKEQLADIILGCMKDMSYEKDFYYFDYDRQKKEYYLEYYCDGEIERFPLTEKEVKNSVFEVGTFWRPFGDGMAREADYMGEGIKSNVEYELDMLDFNKNGDNK